MNQNIVPKNFVAICNVAGISSDNATLKWQEFLKQTIKDAILWLVKDGGLSDGELEKLDEVMSDETKTGDWVEILSPVLTSEQKNNLLSKFGEIFWENYSKMIEEMKKNMTIEQKQILRGME